MTLEIAFFIQVAALLIVVLTIVVGAVVNHLGIERIRKNHRGGYL